MSQSGPCEVTLKYPPNNRMPGPHLSCWGCEHLHVQVTPKYGTTFLCFHHDIVDRHGIEQSITSTWDDATKSPPLTPDWFCPVLAHRGYAAGYHARVRESEAATFQRHQRERETKLNAEKRQHEFELRQLQRELDEFEAARPKLDAFGKQVPA